MSHDEVTCRKLILECLIGFEDGSMPEADRAELQRHFEMCPPCLNFLMTYRATGRTLKMLKPREIPPALADTVMIFVKKRCKKEGG
jgi:anti-sigma factor RsiW